MCGAAAIYILIPIRIIRISQFGVHEIRIRMIRIDQFGVQLLFSYTTRSKALARRQRGSGTRVAASLRWCVRCGRVIYTNTNTNMNYTNQSVRRAAFFCSPPTRSKALTRRPRGSGTRVAASLRWCVRCGRVIYANTNTNMNYTNQSVRRAAFCFSHYEVKSTHEKAAR